MTRWIFCAALLLTAACAPSSTIANTPPQRNPPTLEASGWRDSAEAITLQNAAQVALLGRLDQPETSTTLFDHTVSPDGTRLAALNNDEILAWDLLTGQLVFHTARNNLTHLFYASDKTELYGVDSVATVVVLDAETGSVKTTFAGHNAYSGVVTFDAENDRMALGGRDGTVKVWELFERQALITLNAHPAQVLALDFSDDGTLLASAGGDGITRVWDWQTNQQIAELTLEGDAPQRLAFAPSGEQLALGTPAGVWLWGLNDSPPVALSGGGGANPLIEYAPDDAYLLSGARSSGLTLWNPQTQILIGDLPDVQGSQISADFSPEGTMLLTSALGGSVSLWNLSETGGEALSRANLPTGASQIYAVEWTDDSRLLLLFDATGPVYIWGIGAATSAEG